LNRQAAKKSKTPNEPPSTPREIKYNKNKYLTTEHTERTGIRTEEKEHGRLEAAGRSYSKCLSFSVRGEREKYTGSSKSECLWQALMQFRCFSWRLGGLAAWRFGGSIIVLFYSAFLRVPCVPRVERLI
jgi:hypothetical protein